MKLFPNLILAAILLSPALLFGQVHLPVQLVYFRFSLSDSTVNLEWGTATEVQCYGFNIERNFDNNWTTVGFVPGHGDSNIPWDYSLKDTETIYGNTYLYRLKQIDLNGQFVYSDTLPVSVITVINKIGESLPKVFSVSPNYPNPFNPTTNIDVKISKGSEITLNVFDVRGRLVLNKNYGERLPGIYSISFDGSNLSSGVYYYSISAGEFRQSRAMVLIK